MITLKQAIHYTDTNSVEATWVDRTPLPDLEVPAVAEVLDEDGNVVTPGVEAHTITGRFDEVVVKCHSYADVQMDMLRADLGDDALAFAELIATVEAGIVPPPPPSLADLKVARNAYINAERAKANASTFPHAGKVFACDQLSRGDIDGVNGEVALTGALPTAFPGAWKAVDNSYLPIPDVAAWTLFYQAMVAQGAANFMHAQQLKAALAAATSPEEVAAIVW